jgi:hypothetical protein
LNNKLKGKDTRSYKRITELIKESKQADMDLWLLNNSKKAYKDLFKTWRKKATDLEVENEKYKEQYQIMNRRYYASRLEFRPTVVIGQNSK